MYNVSHMDVHRLYDLPVVHLFKCFFNLRPRAVYTLQASRHPNPALVDTCFFQVKHRGNCSSWFN